MRSFKDPLLNAMNDKGKRSRLITNLQQEIGEVEKEIVHLKAQKKFMIRIYESLVDEELQEEIEKEE